MRFLMILVLLLGSLSAYSQRFGSFVYDRPKYQESVHPILKSVQIEWNKPVYENVNIGNNPIFSFSGI